MLWSDNWGQFQHLYTWYQMLLYIHTRGYGHDDDANYTSIVGLLKRHGQLYCSHAVRGIAICLTASVMKVHEILSFQGCQDSTEACGYTKSDFQEALSRDGDATKEVSKKHWSKMTCHEANHSFSTLAIQLQWKCQFCSDTSNFLHNQEYQSIAIPLYESYSNHMHLN